MKRFLVRFKAACDLRRISWSSRAERLGGLSSVIVAGAGDGSCMADLLCVRAQRAERTTERGGSIHPGFLASWEARGGARAGLDSVAIEPGARCSRARIVAPGQGI